MSHKLLAIGICIIKWLRGIYGELCISRRLKPKYLGMDIDYSVPVRVIFIMEKYTRNVLAEFPRDLGKTTESPAAEYLFTVHNNAI